MKKMLAITTVLCTMALVSCQKSIDPGGDNLLSLNAQGKPVSNTFYGPQVQLGDGHMRSWIRISPEEVPEEIGLEMTAGLFQNLPASYVDLTLPLHHKALEVTPYDHINVDWMPNGHPPGYFQQPHFDIHFYMMTEEEQMAIPPPRPGNTNLALPDSFGTPPAGVLPVDYIVPSAAVAQMGRHWLDRYASVLPPSNLPFKHEFIYGTWNRKVVFLEPMVTRAFLLSGEPVHKTIKQPATYSPTGTYYPTQYNIYTNATTGRVYVSLGQFVMR